MRWPHIIQALLVASLLVHIGVAPPAAHASVTSEPSLFARMSAASLAPRASQGLTFKILQLADLHFTGIPTYPCQDAPSDLSPDELPCTEALMSTFVDDLLDAEQPDFVVFTGDNVQTFAEHDRQRAVDAFTRGVEQRQIPFAVVLGNHDDENGFAREDVLRMTMNKRMSVTQRGPLAVDGVGNYMLNVRAPVGGAWGNARDPLLRLYFLDSGGYPDRAKYPYVLSTYDWIKPSQVEYYRSLSLEAEAATTSSATPLPPALMFFHIPLQEYSYSWLFTNQNDVSGEKHEAVSSSSVPSQLFSALVDRNEVKATFCGHDHTNEYCLRRNGIQLCYGGGAGLGVAYGSSGFARRARVIEWSVGADNTRTIRSWKRLFHNTSAICCEETLFASEKSKATHLKAQDSSASSGRSARTSDRTFCIGTTVLLSVLLLVASQY